MGFKLTPPWKSRTVSTDFSRTNLEKSECLCSLLNPPNSFLLSFQALATHTYDTNLTLRRKTSNKLRHVRLYKNLHSEIGVGSGNPCLHSFTLSVLRLDLFHQILSWASSLFSVLILPRQSHSFQSDSDRHLACVDDSEISYLKPQHPPVLCLYLETTQGTVSAQ